MENRHPTTLSRSLVWIDPDAEPFCPMTRYTRQWGVIVVNPALDNRTRLRILGEALYGDWWQRRVGRDLAVSLSVIKRWAGTGEPDRYSQPPDKIISALIAVVRARVDHLDFAIEESRLPPWVD
jgi:hypothetical protein